MSPLGFVSYFKVITAQNFLLIALSYFRAFQINHHVFLIESGLNRLRKSISAQQLEDHDRSRERRLQL